MSDSLWPMDWTLPRSFVRGTSQVRILEWIGSPYLWHLSKPGIEPTSPVFPALAGRFFTTETSGKTIFIPRESLSITKWIGHLNVQRCQHRTMTLTCDLKLQVYSAFQCSITCTHLKYLLPPGRLSRSKMHSLYPNSFSKTPRRVSNTNSSSSAFLA